MSSSTTHILSSSSSSSSSISPLKRKAMSITQTYYLAHTARGKLSSEAARPDHNLRLLVGHANLLDSLMLELAEAEQEQESWFNQSVKAASKPVETAPKHIQWADTIVEEPEQDWQAEDADSSDAESDFDEDEEMEMASASALSLRRIPSRPSYAVEEDEEFEEDDEEDYSVLSLARTPSRSAQPPELLHDSDDSSSEDESMPPSPPNNSLPSFSEKQRQQIATTSLFEQPQSNKLSASDAESFFEEGFYLPPRTGPGLVSAISVY